MKEAGHPNGFTVDWLTPLAPFYSRGERLVSQLQAIGIRAKLQIMERGVFLQRTPGRQAAMAGRADHHARRAHRRHVVQLVRVVLQVRRLQRRGSRVRAELDAKFARYQASIDPAERKQLAEEMQRAILENYYLVPVFRHAFMCGIGPRIAAQKWQDVWPTITTGYAYPWEDIKLKE